MSKFRFQDLRIWQLAIEIADELFDLADALDQKRLHHLLNNLEELVCRCPITLLRVQGPLLRKNLGSF
jgi:hypothetical protein